MRIAHKSFVRRPKKKGRKEDINVSGRIILDWMLKKQDERAWIEYIWLRIGTSYSLLRPGL
jgi:hypothetical protein